MKKNKKQEFKKFAKDFLKEIKKHDHIVIFNHINPDGDCLGSQFGLKTWLKNKFPDKNIYAIGEDTKLFTFLDWEFDEIPNEQILSSALGIVVDANYSNRIMHGNLITNKKINNMIRIDHHPESDDINYSLRWVDDSYCASAEQVAMLIKHIDKSIINQDIAKYLYLGMYTDSGRFFFDKTSARTHNLCSFLFESGFNFDEMHKQLAKRTMEEINFQKEVFTNMQTHKNVVYYVLKKETIEKLNLNMVNRNRVDFLANIDGYDVWIFFIENEDGSFRVRLRSNSKNVNSVAKEFGGGGHIRASGALIENESLVKDVIEKSSKL